MSQEYNADSIRVLTPMEVRTKFEWSDIDSLAHEYKRDRAWIEMGFRACDEVGVSTDYFVERYLEKDKACEYKEEVSAAYAAIKEARAKA